MFENRIDSAVKVCTAEYKKDGVKLWEYEALRSGIRKRGHKK